jgi:predicted metal-binding protein
VILTSNDQLIKFLVLYASLSRILECAVEGTVAIVFTIEIVSCYLACFAVYLLGFTDLSSRSYLQISLDLFDEG